MTSAIKLRDRLWLWAMKPNVLQESGELKGQPRSTLTAEQAIQRTGLRNVFLAGQLEISEQSLASMPSAERIICKWSMHQYLHNPHGVRLDVEGVCQRLLATKELARQDRRVEAFLVDDFSTASAKAGITSEHLAAFQYLNATTRPQLPLFATIYTLSLEQPGLSDLLRYFDQLVVPLWHATEIESLPQRIERCAELSGNKPMLVCLYLYDFGNSVLVSRAAMQRQLDIVEPLLRSRRITGLLFCGSCMMDLNWESMDCVIEWIERVGDDRIKA